MSYEMNDLQRALGRLEAKVDILLTTQDRELTDLRKRVSALERWRSWLAGGFAVVSFGWGVLLYLLK